jgi:hypothetical protein
MTKLNDAFPNFVNAANNECQYFGRDIEIEVRCGEDENIELNILYIYQFM